MWHWCDALSYKTWYRGMTRFWCDSALNQYCLNQCSSAPFHRTDSRFPPTQWETVLLCNHVSHWLGANLESTLLPSVLLWITESEIPSPQMWWDDSHGLALFTHFANISWAYNPKVIRNKCYFCMENNDPIRPQFCTCHNSRAVVACATLWAWLDH